MSAHVRQIIGRQLIRGLRRVLHLRRHAEGHAAPALFQVLAERGFFDVEMLEEYGFDGSVFGEHPPAPKYLPGIEAATGSLGHGLPMGLGMALAARIT